MVTAVLTGHAFIVVQCQAFPPSWPLVQQVKDDVEPLIQSPVVGAS